jgi:hypothetical protein
MVQEVGHAKLRERGVDLIAADNPASFIDDTPTAKLVRQVLRRRRPKGGQWSLREISAELAQRGINRDGCVFHRPAPRQEAAIRRRISAQSSGYAASALRAASAGS